MSTAIFISDLHLSAERDHIIRVFFDFLGAVARSANELYILGDLFEYWLGDDDADDPFNRSVVASLKSLSASGVALHLMHGNRDFLIGEQFCDATGADLLADPTLIEIAGVRTLLMHGDTLCTDDVDYQRFRAQVRSPDSRHAFLAKPLAQRRAIAEELRRKSEVAIERKSSGIMDVAERTVLERLRENGYPRLIHGHTHRPARHSHLVDARQCERWVLPDWYERGGYLRCDETRPELVWLSA